MTQLQISGMTCDSCATPVEQALEKVPGVRSARVSYAAGTAQLAMVSDTPWLRSHPPSPRSATAQRWLTHHPCQQAGACRTRRPDFPAVAPRLTAMLVHCTSLSLAAGGPQWPPR